MRALFIAHGPAFRRGIELPPSTTSTCIRCWRSCSASRRRPNDGDPPRSTALRDSAARGARCKSALPGRAASMSESGESARRRGASLRSMSNLPPPPPFPTRRPANRRGCSRDPRFDGLFFTAVPSTRIYCRPVCPAPMAEARRRYYASAAAAEAAGYRPCLRCRPELSPDDGAWRRGDAVVARALKLIDAGRAGRSTARGAGRTRRHRRTAAAPPVRRAPGRRRRSACTARAACCSPSNC